MYQIKTTKQLSLTLNKPIMFDMLNKRINELANSFLLDLLL